MRAPLWAARAPLGRRALAPRSGAARAPLRRRSGVFWARSRLLWHRSWLLGRAPLGPGLIGPALAGRSGAAQARFPWAGVLVETVAKSAEASPHMGRAHPIFGVVETSPEIRRRSNAPRHPATARRRCAHIWLQRPAARTGPELPLPSHSAEHALRFGARANRSLERAGSQRYSPATWLQTCARAVANKYPAGPGVRTQSDAMQLGRIRTSRHASEALLPRRSRAARAARARAPLARRRGACTPPSRRWLGAQALCGQSS